MNEPRTQSVRLAAPPDRMSVGHHSGPGLRLAFWVQGCSIRCTRRCLNAQFLGAEGGVIVPVEELTAALLRLACEYREVEGLTVLGGEPFDQARELASALAPARASGLSVMVYTGHVREELAAKEDAVALLSVCDLLVDGPFVDELYDPSLIWRGSTNQRILRLSDRYSDASLAEAIDRQGRAASVSVGVLGDFAVAGAQDPSAARSLRNAARHVKIGRR